MTESPNLADTLTEPADGARLAVRDDKGVWWVVWRNDAEATEDELHRSGEHWFEGWSSFPVSWRSVVENATEAYAIAEKPTTGEPDTISRTPECVAVDKILRWDEVKEGDLALVEGVMMQVEQIYPADEERVVFRWSDGFTREHRLDDLTAVTRYVETTDPDAREA